MKLRKEFHFDQPPERVSAVLCSAAFNVATDEAREDVRSSSYHLVEESNGDLVFEMRSEEYKRTMTGGIDRSGTSTSVVRNEWNANARTLSWVFRGKGMAAKVQISGVYRVQQEGHGTHLVHDVDVEVSIPLVGRKIAKIVAKEFDQTVPTFERLLREHLTGAR